MFRRVFLALAVLVGLAAIWYVASLAGWDATLQFLPKVFLALGTFFGVYFEDTWRKTHPQGGADHAYGGAPTAKGWFVLGLVVVALVADVWSDRRRSDQNASTQASLQKEVSALRVSNQHDRQAAAERERALRGQLESEFRRTQVLVKEVTTAVVDFVTPTVFKNYVYFRQGRMYYWIESYDEAAYCFRKQRENQGPDYVPTTFNLAVSLLGKCHRYPRKPCSSEEQGARDAEALRLLRSLEGSAFRLRSRSEHFKKLVSALEQPDRPSAGRLDPELLKVWGDPW